MLFMVEYVSKYIFLLFSYGRFICAEMGYTVIGYNWLRMMMISMVMLVMMMMIMSTVLI